MKIITSINLYKNNSSKSRSEFIELKILQAFMFSVMWQKY